jgi:hypothetical protein
MDAGRGDRQSELRAEFEIRAQCELRTFFERDVNGKKSHGGEVEAEAEVWGAAAQPLSALRKIARVSAEVRHLPNLLQRDGAVGLHTRRSQGELVTIHFYASVPVSSNLGVSSSFDLLVEIR